MGEDQINEMKGHKVRMNQYESDVIAAKNLRGEMAMGEIEHRQAQYAAQPLMKKGMQFVFGGKSGPELDEVIKKRVLGEELAGCEAELQKAKAALKAKHVDTTTVEDFQICQHLQEKVNTLKKALGMTLSTHDRRRRLAGRLLHY